MKVAVRLAKESTFFERVKRVVTGLPTEVKATNRRYAAILLATIRRNASGAPGPSVDTGQYVGAFVTGSEFNGYGVWVGNPSPQTHRLEAGFVGIDSIGRHYAQPPFPHFGPTFEEVAPRYAKDMGLSVERIINGS